MTLLDTERVIAASRVIDNYIGVAGDPSVKPLGTIAVPIWMVQALRAALMEVAK